jgi:hypothetical protein
MRLFAVRVIKDKQPVGLFWAPDPIALWWMIDSVCDPGECEYLRIKDRAAIVWEDSVNATFGGGISLPLDVPSFQFVEGFYLIWLILGSGHFFET